MNRYELKHNVVEKKKDYFILKLERILSLLNMRNEVPALNANGYVDKDGKNHELSENNEYTKLITQYQYLQYNSLMDKKHVSTDLFSVKDGK